jgi:hypothetical protein
MTQELYKPLNEALAAAARGPFFPDWEFETLFGLTRAEVSALAGSIASPFTSSQTQRLALADAVANLLGYPHGREADWAAWLSVSQRELEAVYSDWRAAGRA